MANFNLDEYEPVEERIKKFYKDYPDGQITSEIVVDDGHRILIKATVARDQVPNGQVWATGYAEEVRGEGFVNKTSAVENCETSAIGRALANANYAGSKRPSREEMEKTQRKPFPVRTNPDTGMSAGEDMITEAQLKKIMAMAKGEIEPLRELVKNTTGKDSLKILNKFEASQVIDALTKLGGQA